MGWVTNRFKTAQKYKTGVPALWNEMRDAIGQAVDEFNTSVGDLRIERKDCAARSQFCMRLTYGNSLEVYIEPEARFLKTSLAGTQAVIDVCAFRVSADLQRLEFFKTEVSGMGDKTDKVLDAEEVCQMAIGDYLFPEPSKKSKGLGVVDDIKAHG